ncbi:MAG: phage tail tape measure protein, partial [Eubacteriales bacterium]|nr:phage tail tape measure protein [Eubacteriales bacterium]
DMENSSGTTAKAYATMTSTAEHAQEVFSTSAENLQITIGEALSPTIKELYNLGTNGLQLIDGFVDEHPEVVQALAAGAVGLGVVAGGLVAYTAATKIAATATSLFTAAMEANPLFMGLTIAAGVITAVGLFASAMANATADANQLTAASQKQKNEIDSLNKEYDEACQKYGKTSDEAIALKLKINDLTTKYEKNKQTLGELIQKQGDLNDKYAELQGSDKSSLLDEEAASAGFLSNKLFSLAEQTNRTAAENQEMYSIINKLNEQFPKLGLNYDNVISKTGKTKEAVQNYLKSLYDQEQFQNAQTQWVETSKLLKKQKEEAIRLGKDVQAAGEEYGKSEGGAIAYHKYQAAMDKMVDYTNSSGEKVKMSLREAFDQANDNIKSMEKELDNYENTMLGISGSNDKNAKSAKDWKSTTSTALQGLQTEIDALAASYDESYSAAYKAITGTVGLTKKLSNETDVTASSLRDNWRDQTEWINTYSSNLEKAQKYGVTKGLIDSLSDGSEQSGQYINQIIKQLDGMNKADAKAFVKGLNSDFKGVTKAEKAFSKTVAQYKTDFNNQMDNMVDKAKTSVESMGLKGKAKQKAVETIQGYIDGINSKLGGVTSAVAAVKSAVKSKLTVNDITPYQTQYVEQNAKGTKHSADIFLAGEKGPELIVNAKGSQVFTAAETQRILYGNADGSDSYDNTVAMFDIPELIAQLMPKKPRGGLTLSEMASNIGDTTTDNSSHTFIHSPTYNISAKSESSIADTIRKADKLSKAEFEKYMKEYESSRKRVSFKNR